MSIRNSATGVRILREKGSGKDAILRTERLRLRRFDLDDAPFVVELVNQRSFKEFIGDKGVSSLADARSYIKDGPLATYVEYGYGPYVVEETTDGAPVGMCGLFKRQNLDHPDLGFAFLERYFRRGFAAESSLGVVHYAGDVLGLPLLAAIVDPENVRSIALIEKLGFEFASMYPIPDEGKNLRYYTYCLERE